jgi:hypothetical protein
MADVVATASLLQATVARLRRTIEARLNAGHVTVTLNRHDALILVNLLTHLSEQHAMIEAMWEKMRAVKQKAPSRVTGLPSAMENVPDWLVLPGWAKPDTLTP